MGRVTVRKTGSTTTATVFLRRRLRPCFGSLVHSACRWAQIWPASATKQRWILSQTFRKKIIMYPTHPVCPRTIKHAGVCTIGDGNLKFWTNLDDFFNEINISAINKLKVAKFCHQRCIWIEKKYTYVLRTWFRKLYRNTNASWGALKMTDMKMADRQNAQAWIWRTSS